MLLSTAWDDYTKAIATGEIREVETKYTALVSKIVQDIVRPQEIASGDVADA